MSQKVNEYVEMHKRQFALMNLASRADPRPKIGYQQRVDELTMELKDLWETMDADEHALIVKRLEELHTSKSTPSESA